MKYNVLGFYQPRAVELGLDSNDLLVLRWFIDYAGTGKMRTLIIDNRVYYWVNYASILEEMPILKITKQTLARKNFGNLVRANVLEHKFVKEGGSFSYYCYGINYETLIYLQNEGGCVKNTEGMSKNTQGYVNFDIGGMSKNTHQINNILDNNNSRIYNTKENILKESNYSNCSAELIDSDTLAIKSKSVEVESNTSSCSNELNTDIVEIPTKKDQVTANTNTSLNQQEKVTTKDQVGVKVVTNGKEKTNKEKENLQEYVLTIFEEVWKIYPRKVNKVRAKQTFLKLFKVIKTREEAKSKGGKIYGAVEKQKKIWERENTEEAFIPHFSSWLNANFE